MSRRPCRNRRRQSSCGTRSLDRRTDAGLVFLEVLAEQIGELPCRRVVSRGVGPRTARPQNVPRHTGPLGRHVKAKKWIPLGLGFRERAVVDRVEIGAGVLEADALTDAVRAAAPACI